MDIVQLIEQLKAGDDTAGPILVSILAPRLLGYAEMIANDLPLADREQAVERAIEMAVRRIDRYDANKGTFPGWVRAFVRHAIGDWRRHHPGGAPTQVDKRTNAAIPADDTEEEHDNPASAALTALVFTAPEADQLIVRLRYEENLPHAQIAERLGVSEPACRKRLERALERLRSRAVGDPDLNRYLEGGNQ
ncbi:MAG: sigma-70 family RNA polymerase sigma factor [Actinomycetota bacterium]|nr:sigma-70 family RNA polymerase sigma factor [Actinomycetota bacterium]